MKGTRGELVRVEKAQVGYVEQGGADNRSGNITKFWADLEPSFQGQPWCAAFQKWSFEKSGNGDYFPKAPQPYYTPSLVQWARTHKLWDTSGHYERGDLVFYSFNGDAVPDHVELVLTDDGNVVHTIGGNTTPTVVGDQRNGGGVYKRERPHGPVILGVIKTSKLLPRARDLRHPFGKREGTPAPKARGKHNPFKAPDRELHLNAHRWQQGDDVRWAQWALAIPVDGTFGRQTDRAVRLFQHQHQLTIDGEVGPRTRVALARIKH